MKLIQDGSDVHALDSSGSTPLNEAICSFVTYCDSSPLKAFKFAHVAQELFKIRKEPSEYYNLGSQSGSRAHLTEALDSTRRFENFLYWWFQRLDDSPYDLNEYIRQEEALQPPIRKVCRDATILGATISKTFHFDKTTRTIELKLEWAWTKNPDVKDLSKLLITIPYA